MSDPREQLVREIFARWDAGERDLDPEEIHPDAVVHSSMTGHTYRGHEEVMRWMAEIDEQFDSWDLTIEEIRSAPGDRLLALGQVHFRAAQAASLSINRSDGCSASMRAA